MAKVITFSMVFPAYHPKAGQPTYFVEKFYNSLFSRNNLMDYPKGLEINERVLEMKNHTIRGGNRWKVRDKFSPRVWGDNINPKSGKKGPYQSNQIILCEDVEIKKIWDFEINEYGFVFINNKPEINPILTGLIDKLAKNDGLENSDLLNWFKYPKPFKGQIICWNESVNY
jgi:hypothetical protein